MTFAQTAVLLFLASMVASTTSIQYYQSRIATGDLGCSANTCGQNARCSVTTDGRPVCACINLHRGDPIRFCERVECQINEDCYDNQVCNDNKCVNPCTSACGANALCKVRNHRTTCSCPPDHDGNPLVSCHYDPLAPCKRQEVCAENAVCRVIGGVPTCTCKQGFIGNGLSLCRHECETDYECGSHRNCVNFMCEDPCHNACGTGANCRVSNHRATCTCPQGWLGNALNRCYPECESHSECPSHKPACLYQKCTDPCAGACGIGANCRLENGIKPVCSCPSDMTGHPFVQCRPYTAADQCSPNPCGTSAECTPGYDVTGKLRPQCKCPIGYYGNALVHCQRGECVQNSDCANNQACIDYRCTNPCTGHECGNNADCYPKDHIATCICRTGFRGDALFACHPISDSRGGRYISYYNK